MRLRDGFLMFGVTAGFALAVTLFVANSGPREPVDRPGRTSAPAEGGAQAPSETPDPFDAGVTTTASARSRAPSEAAGNDVPPADEARRREARKRESAFLAQFVALRAEKGDEAFEQAARGVLASGVEPLARRVAALRALHTAGTPGIDALLARTVVEQPEVSADGSPSLPRAALKLLFERAPGSEDARRALA